MRQPLLYAFHHHVVHRPGWTNTFNDTTYLVHDQHGTQIEDPATIWRRIHQTRLARDQEQQPREHAAAAHSGPAP